MAPMTETDLPPNSPQLYFAEDGNPRSARFDDIYYSLQDGLSETRAVFLTGCGLPEQWAERRHFTVAELGFGTGLNIAALMQSWAENRPQRDSQDGHLHIFSVEAYLMPAEAAARALASWPELDVYAGAIIAQWPPHRRGFHIMTFPEWGVTLTLALMDVREALTQWGGKADAWFLDGFSPAQNPDMWAEDVLAAVAAKTAPGGRLATFTVAGFVRRGLQAAGFEIFKRPGFGRKRERLEAVFVGEAEPPAAPEHIAVIGGGIAGASIVHALRHYGYRATVFDIGPQASGNPAGLVTPRLDAGGGPISALFADALYFAADLYARLCPQAVLSEGVRQRTSDERDAARFARIATQPDFAGGDMVVDEAGLRMRRALSVRPPEVVAALQGDAPVIAEKVVGIETSGTIRVVTETGAYVFDRVFIACGEGIFDLPQSVPLDLRPVRGQIEMSEVTPPDPQAQAWGGYYVPLPGGFVFGSTHIRGDRGSEPREADRAHNLDTLRAVLPDAAELAEAGTQSRAAVRVTTKDHLPVMGSFGGDVASGVHLLTGLGARGLCLGPLLGMAAVAGALGLPSPLTVAAKHRLRPNRFSAN